MMSERIDLSIVLPILNEEANIPKLTDEIVEQLESMGVSYEILGITVPSRDDSWKAAEKLGEKYEHFYPLLVRYLPTRDYQKSYQYMLGFGLSRGKRVIQMDSDYQDDPADIPAFLEKLDEGYDVVVGWKHERSDPFFYTLTSRIQNFVTRIVTGVSLQDKNCGFKAYERSAVEAVDVYGMNYRDIPMQLSAKGFKIAEVPINNRKRVGGKSNFNFFNRLIGGTLDFAAALVSSTLLDKPFRLLGGMGLAKLTISFALLVVYLAWLVVFGGSVGLNYWVFGWILGIVMFGVSGVVFLVGGILAEYVRSLRGVALDDYHVYDDPKGLVKK